MICKAGGVTKREVDSIKILDTETRFEIAPDKAEAFAAMIRENGSGERGVMISRFEEGSQPAAAPRPKAPYVPRDEATPRPASPYAPPADAAPRPAAPYAPRTDAAPPLKAAKPGKHKYGSSTKDKRKPGAPNDGAKLYKPKSKKPRPVAS